MGLILGLLVGYLLCYVEYRIAIERWNYDCSIDRDETWEKETHRHGRTH
jgi:hypothetical protein